MEILNFLGKIFKVGNKILIKILIKLFKIFDRIIFNIISYYNNRFDFIFNITSNIDILPRTNSCPSRGLLDFCVIIK